MLSCNIHNHCRALDRCSFKFIARNGNGVPHELSKRGVGVGSEASWISIPLFWLWDFRSKDGGSPF